MEKKGKSEIVILIPAYEPEPVLVDITAALCEKQYCVVVVNDGSSEKAEPIFTALPEGVCLLRHPCNRGKGAALRTGFAYIREQFADCIGVITADADGQHTLADIIRVAENLREQPDTLILGSRELRHGIPWKSRVGNTMARLAFATASRKWLNDTQTGLRGIPLAWLPDLLLLDGDRYEYEINVLLWAARERKAMREIPIETIYQGNNRTTHFHPIRDAIIIYGRILKFAASSLGAFLIDYVLVLLLRTVTMNLEAELSLLLSVVAARVVSSAFNFLVNRNLVFRHDGKLASSALKYYGIVILLLAVNYGLLSLINLWAGVPLWLAKIIVELLLWIASYYLQRKFVFQ